jgi:D-alanyl-lipoteichoic acid acyltransferase DltB (MBOAT superfamily)
MLFDSPIFFVFLVIVVAINWRLDRKNQNIFLLIASYFFYGWWDYRFLLLMGVSTSIDYLIALKIGRSEDQRIRRRLLVFSLVLNFTFLGVFKYFNFFADSLITGLHAAGVQTPSIKLLRIILPPGISFYTFQEVAYIVDVYKRKIKACDSLLDYALFISLFPHLIAGPIQRPDHLLPQVRKQRQFDDEKFLDGLLLILSGLFRKCVIADNCALIANAAFGGTLGPPGFFTVLLGTYAFAWQVYGDFSGYSDIARGAAQLLGFHFMLNFRQPFLATSMHEFWQRWHISLSTWLRDYVYMNLRFTYRNLMLTMVVCGFWHGANWTYVIWGALHGSILAIERYMRQLFKWSGRPVAGNPIKLWCKRILFFHLLCFTFIFFRATSVAEAFRLLAAVRNFSWDPVYWTVFKFLALFSLPLLLVDLALEKSGQEYLFQQRTPVFRVAVGLATLVLITFFAAIQTNAFIYFQF